MIRRLAVAVLGKREAGEIGYYKRLARVERNIRSAISTMIMSVIMAIFILGMLLVWAMTPMTYGGKDGHADGTGIHYYVIQQKGGESNE